MNYNVCSCCGVGVLVICIALQVGDMRIFAETAEILY